MVRFIALVLVGCVFVAIGGVLLSSRFSTNDYITGSSFTVWVKRTGPEARVNEAVALMGPAAIPDLLELLNWTPNATERNSKKLYEAFPQTWRRHVKALNVSDPDVVRIQALRALGGLGPDALQAVPSILPWTAKIGPVGEEALVAALRIGADSPEVSQKVVTMLMEGQPARRHQAARSLVITEIPLEGGLNPLIESLRGEATPPPEILTAISLYGREAGGAVSRLGPALRNPVSRPAAINLLRAAGSGAIPMLPEIQEDLSQGSPVILEALEIAGGCGPAASPLLSAIQDLESSKHGTVRIMAALARARIGGNPTNAIPVITQELRLPVADETHPYSPMHPGLRGLRLSSRQTAAWILGEMGGSAKAASTDLSTAIRSEDPRLRVLAAWALWKINREVEPSFTTIRRGLGSVQDPVTQRIAIEAVTDLGAFANLAEEDLESVQRQSLQLRGPARLALNRLQGLAPIRGIR
jgi:hypothetical protein